MTGRYLFLCPDRRTASGGIAVIYDVVSCLRQAGYDAAVLHNSPTAGYPNRAGAQSLFYTHVLRRERYRHDRRRLRVLGPMLLCQELLRGGPLRRIQPTPEDVLVVPEYMIAETMTAFPRARLGVFVQNPFSFQWAHAVALSRGHDIRKRAEWFIGVSEVCSDQFDLLGIDGAYHLPVSMKPEEFPFSAEKQNLITYMPRKRPAEARLIVESLRARGRIGEYQIEALDNMPPAEIAIRLQQSRFFISLQKEESIGFPAAEAMAAGCIVVGYTGLGGREYFTPETGIPVTEDDTAGVVRALEAAVADYRADPTRLDALRAHASQTINTRYSQSAFEDALLQIWGQIDQLHIDPN